MRERLNVRDPTDFEPTPRCQTACGFSRSGLFVARTSADVNKEGEVSVILCRPAHLPARAGKGIGYVGQSEIRAGVARPNGRCKVDVLWIDACDGYAFR